MKIVPVDTAGWFMGIRSAGLCGASAAVRLWRRNEVPMFLRVTGDVVFHWTQL